LKIEGVERNLVDEELLSVVLIIVKSEDFSKVRELLEKEEIEFFVRASAK